MVRGRQDGRRGLPAEEQERDASVHRRADRDGLDPDRYDHVPPISHDLVAWCAGRLRCLIFILPASTENVALDLESFSRHAGRTTVQTDDVLLLARRNADLHDIIKDFVDEQNAAKAGRAKGKGKGRPK